MIKYLEQKFTPGHYLPEETRGVHVSYLIPLILMKTLFYCHWRDKKRQFTECHWIIYRSNKCSYFLLRPSTTVLIITSDHNRQNRRVISGRRVHTNPPASPASKCIWPFSFGDYHGNHADKSSYHSRAIDMFSQMASRPH